MDLLSIAQDIEECLACIPFKTEGGALGTVLETPLPFDVTWFESQESSFLLVQVMARVAELLPSHV